MRRTGDADYPLRTDDRPQIELSAARSQRATAAGRRADRVVPVAPCCSAGRRRPASGRLSARQREAVSAALDLFAARLTKARGDDLEPLALRARATKPLAATDADHTDAGIDALERRIEQMQSD